MSSNNEITQLGLYDDDPAAQEIYDPEAHMFHNIEAGHKKIGVIKFDGTAGEAQVLVTDKEIIITNFINGIAVGEMGSVICGPVHFYNNPSDISFNSFWRLNDELLTTIPSTVYTPIPVLRYRVPPYIKNIQRMAKLIAAPPG